METEGNFLVGLFWGVMCSIPLWVSFFGWLKLLTRVFSHG